MARKPFLLLLALLAAGCRHDRVHLAFAAEAWTPTPTRVSFYLDLSQQSAVDPPPPPPFRFTDPPLMEN